MFRLSCIQHLDSWRSLKFYLYCGLKYDFEKKNVVNKIHVNLYIFENENLEEKRVQCFGIGYLNEAQTHTLKCFEVLSVKYYCPLGCMA